MSNNDSGTMKGIVLWLSGVRLEDIRAIPEVASLLQQGAVAELEPSPITGPQMQHYQALSGCSPASSGFFDTLAPRGYAVKEEAGGRGTPARLLPDMLRTVGWTVRYEVKEPAELISSIRDYVRSDADSPSCLILKCAAGEALTAPMIAEGVRIGREYVGETGLLALLSDTRPALIKRFVNVNNFLAEMGVIERDEQSGEIDWQNSLAYYMGHGQLWVNLLGRDAQGAVHPQDEYAEVLDTLVRALPGKLRDATTDEPVIERVYRKEELYSGEYLFCAPDLIVVPKSGYAPSPRSAYLQFDEAICTTPPAGTSVLSGIHPSAVRGFLLAFAPVLAAGASAPELQPLTAVVPTLLHALGVEYVDVESPAIAALFSPSYLEMHPVRSGMHARELSEEDEELIIGHLRDLGYV